MHCTHDIAEGGGGSYSSSSASGSGSGSGCACLREAFPRTLAWIFTA